MAKVNIVFDATMLDTYEVCDWKFNLRFNLNKVTPTKAKPLDRGGLFHVGQENYWQQLKDGGSTDQNWVRAVEKGLVSTRVAAMESDLDSAEVNRIFEVQEEVFKRWKNVDLMYEILAVEQAFMYPLYDDENFRILMIGKIDLLVNIPGKYENLPIDHKSYERDFPVRRNTNQFTNYACAVGSSYLLVNRIGMQTSISPDKKHKRVPLSYDPLFFDSWKQNVIRWAMRYYDSTENNDWPMNTTSCDKFNRICEYYEICDTSGEQNKIYKLNTNFKTDTPWDVSKAIAHKE